MIAEISEVAKETTKKTLEVTKNLDKPLNKDIKPINKENDTQNKLKDLDKPLNKKANDIGKIERMEPPVVIGFKCPQGVDRKEFIRQLKGQERGLNSQSVAENMKNREEFEKRRLQTGNGRDLETAKKAQEIARQKAEKSRIESNQKKGMSYSEAKKEANEWIKTQSALHNPDQIAGGEPGKVSRMGDSNVNSSIGAQWKNRVEKLSDAVNEFAKGKTQDQLENIKMNVKLVVV